MLIDPESAMGQHRASTEAGNQRQSVWRPRRLFRSAAALAFRSARHWLLKPALFHNYRIDGRVQRVPITDSFCLDSVHLCSH
jgi:hypothetical protein